MATNRPAEYTVSVESARIRLSSGVWQTHFVAHDHVRVGTHGSLPLIYIQPTAETSGQWTYRLSPRRYDGYINCQDFLQVNNYHHTESTSYRAHWVEELSALVVDLSDPVREL